MEIKTLDQSSKTFDVSELKRRVMKVEKWTTTETTSETILAGGGGKIKTGWDGKVSGRIDKINATSRHSTKSNVNTRLYLDDGHHFTFPNFDFITMEGNEVRLAAYEFEGNIYTGAIHDQQTGCNHEFFKPEQFLEDIVKVKSDKGNTAWYALAISLGMIGYVYYQLSSWEWWAWAKYTVLTIVSIPLFVGVTSCLNGPKDQTVTGPDFDGALNHLKHKLKTGIAAN